jgi:hypothetical protein
MWPRHGLPCGTHWLDNILCKIFGTPENRPHDLWLGEALWVGRVTNPPAIVLVKPYNIFCN